MAWRRFASRIWELSILFPSVVTQMKAFASRIWEVPRVLPKFVT